MLVATQNEVFAVIPTPEGVSAACLLEDCKAGAVVEARGCRIVVSQDGRCRIWRDGAASEWQGTGIGGQVTSALAVVASPLTLLLGTEPPHVYRVEADVGSAVRMETFEQLDCRAEWYTPWGGPPAVRSMARGGGETVYADIHVGSIMRSEDGGHTWHPVTPQLHKDVHQVNTTPAAANRVYANTADAVWVSCDCGDSWQHRPFPVEVTYGRAIAIHPENPDCLLATVSDGPHGEDVHGRLFRSEDAGGSWTHVTNGFPDSTRDNINTHRVAFDSGGTAWVAVAETLYRSNDGGVRWKEVWNAPDEIELLDAQL